LAREASSADVDAIVTTPRKALIKLEDFLRVVYEEGSGPIELPEYTARKLRAKQEAPVTKTHEKRNFKGIHQNEQLAASIVHTSLKT